ncbi:hypothetical protein BJX62DRAFT_216813 [Aspergillus germanicus]
MLFSTITNIFTLFTITIAAPGSQAGHDDKPGGINIGGNDDYYTPPFCPPTQAVCPVGTSCLPPPTSICPVGQSCQPPCTIGCPIGQMCQPPCPPGCPVGTSCEPPCPTCPSVCPAGLSCQPPPEDCQVCFCCSTAIGPPGAPQGNCDFPDSNGQCLTPGRRNRICCTTETCQLSPAVADAGLSGAAAADDGLSGIANTLLGTVAGVVDEVL